MISFVRNSRTDKTKLRREDQNSDGLYRVKQAVPWESHEGIFWGDRGGFHSNGGWGCTFVCIGQNANVPIRFVDIIVSQHINFTSNGEEP